MSEEPLLILGAGPAGLTAAYQAVRRGLEPVVLERAGVVGGLARTERFAGFLFDMGGHRFFSRHAEIHAFWDEVLGPNFLTRGRLSRIYYDGKLFDYPLKAGNALAGMGPLRALGVAGSYLWWHLFPYRDEETFEQWVTNRFGRRLFETFFRSYTEKVWGISCSELRAEWAAQRIRDLSLGRAVAGMLRSPQNRVRSLIDQFRYPREGPGMLWQAVRERVERAGGRVLMNHEVREIRREGNRVTGVVAHHAGEEVFLPVGHVISSLPLTLLVDRLAPAAPDAVLVAARGLRYRAFLTVCLIVDREDLFPDQWIYVHDPTVRMGRVQNYRNWSPAMTPEPGKTGLGLEYFCTAGDDLWELPDADLIALGTEELGRMGLIGGARVLAGTVFRVADAYPVYDSEFAPRLKTIREFVSGLTNLQTIGRNGLFRYNNMDHSMLTAMYAIDNLGGPVWRDVWSVNEDRTYHEQGPATAPPEPLDAVFLRIDRTALGLAAGVLCGAGLFLLTLVLVLKGSPVVGPTLGLLANFFPGYSVTFAGSLVGLAYGFLVGFAGGFSLAALRNLAMAALLIALRRKERRARLARLVDCI